MNIAWFNVYSSGAGGDWSCPEGAEFGRMDAKTFIRVEERWNGHWLRPPVGMRAAQASHYWIRKGYTTNRIPCGIGPWELEPRA